jgi:2-phospho-L-lactate/phosphoenolpyruvate guanylyltransferase
MFTALIPVKEFKYAKRRLAPALLPHERQEFAAAMLVDVLEVISKVPSVSNIVVVTADSEAKKLAGEFGARVLDEAGRRGLNGALDQGVMKLRAEHVPAVMIVPTDVVLARVADFESLLRFHRAHKSDVTIVSAKFDYGTNCLVVTPPDAIPFCFGGLSSMRHLIVAKARGFRANVVNVPNLDRDIDLISDLDFFCRVEPQGRAWEALKKNGVLERLQDPAIALYEVAK